MRDLSNNTLAQLFTQSSDDPFLTLYTLDHPDWDDPIYLVNNTEEIISNGETFIPFPVNITLPVDDGETIRSSKITLDNVSRDLIDVIRATTDNEISAKIQMVLASAPDTVEIEIGEMKIVTVQYDEQKISATLTMDDFLNTEVSGEKYTPSLYPGLF